MKRAVPVASLTVAELDEFSRGLGSEALVSTDVQSVTKSVSY